MEAFKGFTYQEEESKLVFSFEDENNLYTCRRFGSFGLSYDVLLRAGPALHYLGKILGHMSDREISYTITTHDDVFLEKATCPKQAFFRMITLYEEGAIKV